VFANEINLTGASDIGGRSTEEPDRAAGRGPEQGAERPEIIVLLDARRAVGVLGEHRLGVDRDVALELEMAQRRLPPPDSAQRSLPL
jgi:hypothetical protein